MIHTIFFGFCLLLSSCVTADQKPDKYTPLSPQQWYSQGAETASHLDTYTNHPKRAKNVILFVGDGMSVATTTAARILQGQLAGNPGEENLLSFERFPKTAMVKTYNSNQQTPDSAGTMTAMMSGIKTKSGAVAVNGNIKLGVCEGKKHHVPTLLEMAENKGFRTGIVSTARITHATPAATFAHVEQRDWESDADMTAEMRNKGCVDIASQLINFPHGDGLEVVLGGGRRNFIPKGTSDPEYILLQGMREDSRNLMTEWEEKYNNSAAIWNLKQFKQINTATTDHLLGLFETSHMQYEQDRAKDLGGEPSLTEMSLTALEILQRQDQRFFLMVEAGRIDHGHHGGIAHRDLADTIAFSDAIEQVIEHINLDETLVLVTADHSHTMSFAGYPKRGNPILGKVITNDPFGEPSDNMPKDETGKPYTTLSYANGPGYVSSDKRVDLSEIDTTDKKHRQIATIPLRSETHSGEDVVLFATGAGSHMVSGVIEQNVIYHIMKIALDL